MLATTVFSAVQLGWIPPAEGRIAGITALFATVPLQLLAAVIGFLGVVLLVAGACMLVPAVSAGAKLVPGAVMALAGVRFAITGVFHLTASVDWKAAAGWIGLALGVLAFYAALALELEGATGRAVLPLGRREPAEPAGEPGVRSQL